MGCQKRRNCKCICSYIGLAFFFFTVARLYKVMLISIEFSFYQWRRKHETSGGADRVGLRSSPARAARPPRVARNFFSLGALKWSRIALMGSLQISTGSALGKSSMQE